MHGMKALFQPDGVTANGREKSPGYERQQNRVHNSRGFLTPLQKANAEDSE